MYRKLIWLWAAVALSACGGTDESQPTAAPEVVIAASQMPSAPAAPSPSPAPSAANLREAPLAELAPEAVAYLEGRDGPAGVAVAVPSSGVVYTWNGHEKFHMASVAKVGIMLTLMDQASKAGRALTGEELELLRPMITVSDNTTASALWNRIGGGQAVEDYLRSIGLSEIDPNKDSCWGASYASAHDMALLFAKLALGEILDDDTRRVAFELLQEVDPEQTWGVIAPAPYVLPEGTIIGVKDGWYPAECGWWVNSVGMLLPGNDRPAYTMAVLTAEQATWEYGMETIEVVGRMVHERLHAP
jgi:hypothetical protein